MEKEIKVYMFEGEQGTDFRLWQTRTKSALQFKEYWSVIEKDPAAPKVSEDRTLQQTRVSEDDKKIIIKALAMQIQALETNSLTLWLTVKDSPAKMWMRVNERYAAANTATKVQL